MEFDISNIYDSVPGAFLIYDKISGKFIYISKGILSMFGCSEEVFRDRFYNSFDMMIYKNDRRSTLDLIKYQSENSDMIEVNFRVKGLLEDVKFMEYKGKVVTLPDGREAINVMLNDVTEMVLAQREMNRMNEQLFVEEQAKQEELRNKVRLDGMTGVLNKVATQATVEEYLRTTTPDKLHALMMIDTDHFKQINDTFGHKFGDDVIKLVASAIKGTFRDSDTVGRVGGDEFMVFMKNTTKDVTLMKAKELNDRIKQTFEKDGQKVSISCSIGISFYPKHGITYETMFANADDALYTAKESGRDRFVVCDI